MNDLSPEQKILLQEYSEAGQVCRNADQLVRTGISIFAAVQAAIIGFIGTQKGDGTLALQLLKALGLWLSFVVYLTTLRLHYRYKSYMARMRSIENKLGMHLYRYSYRYFGIQGQRIPGQWRNGVLSKCIGGNKRLWASIPLLTFVLYLLLIFWDWIIALPSLIEKFLTIGCT
jgi:hypothetical protein